MKNLAFLLILTLCFSANFIASAQQKHNDMRNAVKQTLASGTEVSFLYGQPQQKGKTMRKDLDPKDGKVWRTGPYEAAVFETTKPVKINGKDLPAGKYSFFTIAEKDVWTLIFNKTWYQWGTFDYNEKDDVLRVQTKSITAATLSKKLGITINSKGEAFILWGDKKVDFMIE